MKEYTRRCGVRVSIGNFYRELQSPVTSGLIRTAAKADGDSRRIPYEITRAGVVEFDTWFCSVSEPPRNEYHNAFTARALFAREADPSSARTLLERWQADLRFCCRGLEEKCQGDATSHPEPDAEVRALFRARQMKHVAADLEFVVALRSACERWGPPRRAPTTDGDTGGWSVYRRRRRPPRRHVPSRPASHLRESTASSRPPLDSALANPRRTRTDRPLPCTVELLGAQW